MLSEKTHEARIEYQKGCLLERGTCSRDAPQIRNN